MYKLGCNWSYILKRLIEEKKIKCDYIKTGEQSDFLQKVAEIRKLGPILLHGGLGRSIRTGITDVDMINFEYLNRIISYCDTPQYAIHIGLSEKEKNKLLTDENIYLNMVNVINTFKKKLMFQFCWRTHQII